MNILIKKPHLTFLLAIPIIIVIGIFSTESVLDINIHDTYFVISHAHLAMLISINFGITGLGYWVMFKTNRKLSIWLSLFHIVLTFGGIILIWILSQLFRESTLDYEFNSNLNLAINLILVVLVLGQIIFPVNVIYGLVKKNDKIRGK